MSAFPPSLAHVADAEATHLPLDVGGLFDAHAGWVHRLAQRLTSSSAAADDVVQEVFLLAHRRRGELTDRVGIRTWLYRATVNVARQSYRTGRRYSSAMERAGADQGREGTNPEAALMRHESAVLVRACVASISDAGREVFVLYELERIEGAEIAEILEIPVNTVWSRLRLARVAFREAWRIHAGGAP
ncbi:hypothetical protein LBMAG42_40540 [Deltaproteobacteria bacterium]|nr:hypothetical protein LBMAG42_40540 [Deltaproteobacteria bacterium]